MAALPASTPASIAVTRVPSGAYNRGALNVGFTVGALFGGLALATGSLTVIRFIPILTAAILLVSATMISRLPRAAPRPAERPALVDSVPAEESELPSERALLAEGELLSESRAAEAPPPDAAARAGPASERKRPDNQRRAHRSGQLHRDPDGHRQLVSGDFGEPGDPDLRRHAADDCHRECPVHRRLRPALLGHGHRDWRGRDLHVAHHVRVARTGPHTERGDAHYPRRTRPDGSGPLVQGTVSDGESPAQTLTWVVDITIKAPPQSSSVAARPPLPSFSPAKLR